MFDFQNQQLKLLKFLKTKIWKIRMRTFERGYGTTLGNSLRRIMLSSPARCSSKSG